MSSRGDGFVPAAFPWSNSPQNGLKIKEATLGSSQGWPCQVNELLLVIALLGLLQALGMLRQRPGPTGCDKGMGISLRVGFH